MGFHNISQAGGIGLAVTGLTIVFAALVLVSLFIAGLPRVLPLINALLPVAEGHHGVATSLATSPTAASVATNALSDEVVAAIGVVLHKRQAE